MAFPVVHLSGAIFFDEESTFLRVHVKDALDKSRQIVFDLGNITRMDSDGLGTLVALQASARKVCGDIKLANLGDHIKEALRITRLVTVFDIFDSIEEAVASFNRAAAAWQHGNHRLAYPHYVTPVSALSGHRPKLDV